MNRDEQITRIKATHRERLPEPKAGWPPKVRRAVIFIIAHLFDEQLTVGWMKQQCRINGHNFAAVFARCMGRRPKKFINYHRVEAAKKLLAAPGLQKIFVSAISYEVGFSDPSVFTNAFKRRTGIPPSIWRKQHG